MKHRGWMVSEHGVVACTCAARRYPDAVLLVLRLVVQALGVQEVLADEVRAREGVDVVNRHLDLGGGERLPRESPPLTEEHDTTTIWIALRLATRRRLSSHTASEQTTRVVQACPLT